MPVEAVVRSRHVHMPLRDATAQQNQSFIVAGKVMTPFVKHVLICCCRRHLEFLNDLCRQLSLAASR